MNLDIYKKTEPRFSDRPFVLEIVHPHPIVPSRYDNHIVRRLSAMHGQFADQKAYETRLEQDDTVLYEVYEVKRPEVAGEMLFGFSIVHPGKVGNEYFMTKGHFHAVLDTSEVYYCLQGHGCMVMENPEGDWAVEFMRPNTVLYVPPRWAHRSVNISADEDLVTFFVYPGNAGHDYGTIERQGFRKLVIERNGVPEIIDNPRWSPRNRS
jgi:glucose-6-phosphate isomerase